MMLYARINVNIARDYYLVHILINNSTSSTGNQEGLYSLFRYRYKGNKIIFDIVGKFI